MVAGVFVALILFAVTQWRAGRREQDGATDQYDDFQPANFQPASYGPKPPPDDEWVVPSILVLVAAALGAGYILVSPRLITAVTFGIIGLALGSALSGLILRLLRGRLARGAAQTLIRATLLAAISAVSLSWTMHATYDRLSLSQIRSKIDTARLGKRISALNNTFHAHGAWLAASIAVGTLFVVAACLIAAWAVLAALAMSRVNQGPGRRMTRTFARFHTQRQIGHWANAVLAMICGFALCSGLALYWTNPARLSLSMFDLGSSPTKHTAPPSQPYLIPHVRSTKVSALRACTAIDNLKVGGSTFIHELGTTDGALVATPAHRAAPLVLAVRHGGDFYITDAKGYDVGLRCIYRRPKSPLISLRIDFVSNTDTGPHGFKTKAPGRTVVKGKYGVVQLPSRAGKSMVAVAKSAVDLIRYK
jgi:hypothetical protein